MSLNHRRLAAPALLALTAACATGGPPAPDLAYDRLLGLWEMGDAQSGFVTSRVDFLEGQRVRLQCDTAVPMRPSDPPREVLRRGRGWAFRGCGGEVTVRSDTEGRIQAYQSGSISRATVGRGCDRVDIDARGERCATYGDNIGTVSRSDYREVGFWRSGQGGPPSGP